MSRIRDFLISNGYSLQDVGEFYRTACLYRSGDNPTSLSINKKTGAFRDWKTNTYGSFTQLVQLITGKTDLNDKKIQAILKEIEDNANANQESQIKIKVKKYYDESILDRLIPHYGLYEKDKKIPTETLKEFRAGLAQSGQLRSRIVFPIFNRENRIEGFFGRFHKTETPENSNIPKTKNIGSSSSWIYPAFLNDGIVREKKKVLLVEGISDLLPFWSVGIKNVLVTFGAKISPSLLIYLSGLVDTTIIIGFNNDLVGGKTSGAGNLAAKIAKEKLAKIISSDRVTVELPKKYNDWSDFFVSDKGLFQEFAQNLLN